MKEARNPLPTDADKVAFFSFKFEDFFPQLLFNLK